MSIVQTPAFRGGGAPNVPDMVSFILGAIRAGRDAREAYNQLVRFVGDIDHGLERIRIAFEQARDISPSELASAGFSAVMQHIEAAFSDGGENQLLDRAANQVVVESRGGQQVMPFDDWHRRPIPTNEKGEESIPTEEVQGGAAAGTNNNVGRKGAETAIMPQPKRIRWNLPDYNHAKLVYCFHTDEGSLETGTYATNLTDLLINVNGCHDIIDTNAQFTSIRDNFTVATGVDTASTTNQPRGWAYWKAIYGKYTVLNCEYDITAVLYNNSDVDPDEPVAGSIDASSVPLHQFWFGNEVGAQSNDYDTSALVIMQDLGIKHTKIQWTPTTQIPRTIFGATNDLVVVRQNNIYMHTWNGNANQNTYNKFAREVTDDDTNVIWNNTTENGSLSHKLRIGVRPITGHYQATDRIRYTGRLIYTVQFRQKNAAMHGYRMELIPGSTTTG